MFSKILLLIVVIAAAWFGWRWVSRVTALGEARTARRRAPAPSSRPVERQPAVPDAEDMEKCPECGAYVAPRMATSCGRTVCPYA